MSYVFLEKKLSQPSTFFDENDINKLSSKINIQSSEILKWLKWIDKSYIYINYQIKINKLEDSIKMNIKNNKLINENFIIEKHMFNEKKNVNIK